MSTLFTLAATADLLQGSRASWTAAQPTDVVNKSYVDSAVAAGVGGSGAGTAVGYLAPVQVASVVSLPAYTYSSVSGTDTLTATGSGALSLDGVTNFTVGVSRVLIKNETSTHAPYNGIYTVSSAGSSSTSWVLSRSTDFSKTTQMIQGTEVTVTGGTSQSNTIWILQGSVTTLDTSPITFAPLTISQATISSSNVTSVNLLSLNYAQYNSTSTAIDLTKTFHIFQSNTTTISVTFAPPTSTTSVALYGFSNCGSQLANIMFGTGFPGAPFIASNGDTSAVGLQLSTGQSIFLIFNPVTQQYQSMMGGANVLV